MPSASKCARCSWENRSVDMGSIRGLCSECTKYIKELADYREIYLGPRMPPIRRKREVIIEGIALFWWDGIWRVK